MSTLEDYKQALYLAGKMSDAARRITGGLGLNGKTSSCSIRDLSSLLDNLQQCIDEYDDKIVQMVKNKENE